jgi:phenylacetate-CoA ligase
VIQELLIAAWSGLQKAIREGTVFEQLLSEAELRQYWQKQYLDIWCQGQLQTILHRAQTLVPYYRSLYQHLPLEHEDARQWLKQYTLLYKQDIVANPSALIAADSHYYQRFSSRTSGTTGSPFTLYKTFASSNRENAFVWRQMHWAHYQKGGKIAWLRGDLVVPEPLTRKAPFWRMDRSANTLRLSSYHLSEQNVEAYFTALRQFNPMLIQAYPSSIGYLANWLWQRGQVARISGLKSIMTSSETLSFEQRQRIETTFGVKVFDWYGSTEQVAAIGTCEHGHYHIIEDYGFTELLPTGNEGLHELVSTGFNNYLMPLIRYATGDWIEPFTTNEPCACKRPFRRIKRIVGRMNDVIKTPDGRQIGLIDPIYNGLTEIAEGQVVQHSLDRLEIQVVPAKPSPLSQATRQQLTYNIRARVGLDMDIAIVEIDKLPRGRNGKLRTIISQLTTR